MFPPKYAGTVFNVYLSEPDVKGKETLKCHIITEPDNINLISNDWKNVIRKIPVADVERAELRKNIVALIMKGQPKPTTTLLDTKPDPPNKLHAALSIVQSEQKVDLSHKGLSFVIPTMNLPDKSKQMVLHKRIIDCCKDILAKFRAPIDNCGALIDIFTCVYRYRYSDSACAQDEKNTNQLAMDIRRQIAVTYGRAIMRSMQALNQLHEEANYFITVAVGASEFVKTACEGCGINSYELHQVVQQLKDIGDTMSQNVFQAAERIVQEAQNAYDISISQEPPFYPEDLNGMISAFIFLLGGTMVNLYKYDGDILADRALEFAHSTSLKLTRNDPKNNFKMARRNYCLELLRFMDGRRYDPSFAHVYAIFNRQEIDVANDI